MEPANAVLLLEDGTAFHGMPFGHAGEAIGHAVFYTGVVGYQEVLTDPSYRATLVTLTYPVVGSYGVNDEDNESSAVQASGVVIRDYSSCVSNFRATGSLEDLLKDQQVVGIRGVDTRAVAVHLREHGEMRASIASDGTDRDALMARLQAAPDPLAADLVADLPIDPPPPPQGEAKTKLVALNLGPTRSLLAQLADLGCTVHLLPAGSTADEVLAAKPHAVLLAGGPGDPRVLEGPLATTRALLGRVPVLGIGLGHQLLALALGGSVSRMKTGHHGVNYPVRTAGQARCDITVQRHSFVVDGEAVPEGVEITHTNINDGTVEGLCSRESRAASVQFHPSRDETGRPSSILARFLEG